MAANSPVITEDPISQWLKHGELDKLEQAVLDGYGDHLSGKTSRLPQVNRFLKQVPDFQVKIEEIHRAITLGKYRSVQHLIDRKKYAFCRDQMGATPLHKAVIYGQTNIINYLLERYGTAIHARDHRGRTALHYAAVLADGGVVFQRLIEAGADQQATDMFGKKPDDYLQSQGEISAQVLREGSILPSKPRKSRKQSRIIDPTSLKFYPSRSLMHRSNIKELIRQGNLSTLEEVVLQGFGDRLLGETSSAPLVQEFLEKLPDFIDQITELHRTAMKGNLREFQGLLDRKSMVTARDQVGATPLHKAVLYGHYDLAEYIATNFPATLDARDNDGRTALHYASALDDDRNFYNMLVKAGASPLLPDFKGKNADFYLRFPDQINLQQIMKRSQRLNANYAINTANRIKSKSPSRRKERSLSPSYRLKRPSDSMNGFNGDGHSEEAFSDRADTSSTDGSQSNQGLNYYRKGIDVSSANLKRWIQENNLEMLEGVVLEGHGNRLKEKAEYFTDDESVDSKAYIMETVPQMMNKIRIIHAAVSVGDLIGLQDNLERRDYVLSKDHLGMAPLHKATIMGHIDLVEYILDKFPETVNHRDKDGRTALHYSAATTNRNGNKIYRMLIRAGADPRIRDSSGKTAEYYRVHLLSLPNELSRINSKKKLNPLSLTETQSIRRKPLLLHNIQERITTALHDGDAKQLQELVLEGYGDTLFGRTSWGEEARKFLKGLPHLMDQIKTLHASTINGDLTNVERILADDSSLNRAKDENGLLPIHIATAHNRPEVVDYLIVNYPQCIQLKDSSGRTALHISAQSKTIDIYRKLVEAGGDPKIMDKNGKTADHYLRAQTIQNYDFVSPLNGKPLNGENVNNNSNNKILEQNIIDSKDFKRKQSKPKIKPVTKPMTKTSKTSVKSNDDNTRKEIIVDSTDPNNNRSDTSASDVSLAAMSVPSNRLPALKSDESTGLENSQNQIEVSEEQEIDNKITEQTTEEETDSTVEATTSPIPSAPPLEETQEPEPEAQESADINQELTEPQTEKAPTEDKSNDDMINEEKVGEQMEEIRLTDETEVKDSETVETQDIPQTEEQQEEPQTVAQQITQEGGESELKDSNESEATLSNEEKSVDIISDNQVSVEANQSPEETPEKQTNPNGDQMNAQEINETVIIDNTNTSANIDGRELNAEQSGQLSKQSDQTIETSETVETTDTKLDINSDNICANSEETNEEDLQLMQNQTNNADTNEESIAATAEESLPLDNNQTKDSQLMSENQILMNNTNETNGADNENTEQNVNQNDDNSGINETKPELQTQSRRSSVASIGSNATTRERRFSRTLSQQSIGENKSSKLRRMSKSGSQQSSAESVDENQEMVIKSDSRRSSNAGSRRPSIQSLRRKSGTESGVGKALIRQSSKILSTKEDSELASEAPEEVVAAGEDIVNKVISDSLATIKSQESFDESNSQQKQEEEQQETDDQKDVTQEEETKEISDVIQIEEVAEKDNENQEENTKEEELKQTKESEDDKIDSEGQQTVNDNEVPDYYSIPIQATDLDSKEMESDVQNIVEATADGEDNETEINESQTQEAINERQEVVTQTSDTIVAKDSTNDDITDDNENKNEEISEKCDQKSEDQNDDKLTNEGSNAQTIDDSSEGVVNDENNNKDNREEETKRTDSSLSNGRDSTQLLERSFSRQSTVSTINPQTDDRLNELIDHWIQEADLLRLEHVVIAGQGIRLIGRHSSNKQVQDFLDLVPTYMNKIRTVHETVIRGNLNEVKQVLTRKRFALSRDHVGASPLHLAVLHAHLDVMLYIISQFPETINGPDNEGRTPLHYAAVMSDEQKEFYKLLVKAGADPSLRDKRGQTPQCYLENPGLLTVRQLLENYMPPIDNNHDEKSAEVWRRPPTADIESRLTPTPDDSDSPMPSPNNKHEVDAEVHVDADARRSRLSHTFSRSDSQTSVITRNEEQLAEDEDFETMSNEFKKSLKEEKFRLQKSFDRQMSTPDALAMNGSVVDNVQEAQPPVGSDTIIMNGVNSSGFDLTEIKDENGQTVLHQLAAKPHQRTGF